MITWKILDANFDPIADQQYLLIAPGRAAVLAVWNEDGWYETLRGEFYGLSVEFDPTHYAIVEQPR